MDPKMKIQKYFSKRILSLFYKVVVVMQIFKVKVRLLHGPTRFLTSIWIEKLKLENMFLLGSYLVFYDSVADLEIVKVNVICYLALSLPIWHTDPEMKMQKYVSTRI